MSREEQNLVEIVPQRDKMNSGRKHLMDKCNNLAKNYYELYKDGLQDVLALMLFLQAIPQVLKWIRLYKNNADYQNETGLLEELWDPQLAVRRPAQYIQHTVFLTYLPKGAQQKAKGSGKKTQNVQRETVCNGRWDNRSRGATALDQMVIRKLSYVNSQQDAIKLNMIEISLDPEPQYTEPCVALCLTYEVKKPPMLYLLESLPYILGQTQVGSVAPTEQEKIDGIGESPESAGESKSSIEFLVKGKRKIDVGYSHNMQSNTSSVRDTSASHLHANLQEHCNTEHIPEKVGLENNSQVFGKNKKACLRVETNASYGIEDLINLSKNEFLPDENNTSRLSQIDTTITTEHPYQLPQVDTTTKHQYQANSDQELLKKVQNLLCKCGEDDESSDELTKTPQFKEILESYSYLLCPKSGFPNEIKNDELPSFPSVTADCNSMQDEIIDEPLPPFGSFPVKLTETEPQVSYNDLKSPIGDIEDWES